MKVQDPRFWLERLVSCPSVTPKDAGCEAVIHEALLPLGFQYESLAVGEVSNGVWHVGPRAPTFVFLGHTDVVPPGPREAWASDPFVLHTDGPFLYGRGVADMKGGIACMLAATHRCWGGVSQPKAGFSFWLTSDEEGPSIDGIRHVAEVFSERGQLPSWCLVGEASSESKVGDTIKIAGRGSLTGFLKIHGIQGHVGYPKEAQNAIHAILPLLERWSSQEWDEQAPEALGGHTQFQCVGFHSGVAKNVIPGHAELTFNLRYAPAWDVEALKKRMTQDLEATGLQYTLTWDHGAWPYQSKAGRLRQTTEQAIETICGRRPQAVGSGGTSDGRFLAPLGVEVLELGPPRSSIHQVNESVRIEDLEILTQVYQCILEGMIL